MTKFKFWNEVCKYGAIIGLVMSVAFVIEQSLMLSGWFSTMGLVWVLAAVVYIVLLYRFAKRRREQYGQEQGFPFGHGLGKLPASMEGVFAEMLKTIQEASEPSIQATVGASIWGNLIVGLVLGLILAGILARAPRPFGPQSEE